MLAGLASAAGSMAAAGAGPLAPWGGPGRALVPLAPGDLPAPSEDAAAARGRVQEILARPEFRPKPRSLVERFLDAVGELFDKIVGGVGGGNQVVAWGAVAVVTTLLGLVLWRAVRALQTDPGLRGGGVAVDGRRRPPADWRAEAAAHEAAGRWRDAVRCTWRATVAELAVRGLIEEVPGRTTGEYRAGVARSLGTVADPFSQATVLFEDAWYAAVEIGPAEAAEERALTDRVLAEARR